MGAFKHRELDRATKGHQPSSRIRICFFVRGTGGALPEPNKLTSSRLIICQKKPTKVAQEPDII